MKAITSVLVLTFMAFALVSTGEAAIWSCCSDNPGVFAETLNTTTGDGFRDADRTGNLPTGTPYPCIASPAYSDYIDASAVSCSLKDKATRVPEHMGPGI